MRPFLYSIDRWGPALVSVLTLFFLSAFGWSYSVKVARLEGRLEALQNQVNQQEETKTVLRNEITSLSKWMIAVHERGSAAGWKLPEIPVSQVTVRQNKPNSKPQTKK